MTLIIDPATGRPFGQAEPSPLEAVGATPEKLRAMLAGMVATGDARGAERLRETDPLAWHLHESFRAAVERDDLVLGSAIAYVVTLYQDGHGEEILAGLLAFTAGVSEGEAHA